MTAKEIEIMEKLHKVQLKLLEEFDRICRLHNISYYLAAGTLLGAVRHKDFIPWDDDIDIYLSRKNYDEFMKHISEFLDPFEVHYPKGSDPFFWDYTTRLVYKNSKLKFNEVENKYYHHKNNEYLFLDIFILDKTCSGFKNRIQLLKLKIIYGLAMSRRYKIVFSDYQSKIGKMQAFVLSHIGKLFSLQYLLKVYKKESTKYNNSAKAFYEQPTNITVKFLGKLFYKEEWHKNYVELQIQDKKFFAPEKYQEVLTSVYGNYMELPPKEMRIPEHIEMLEKVKIDC